MSAPDHDPVPVGARAGEYEVRALLGRGGMGIVYAGIHPVIGKEVAIKVLDPRLATSETVVARFVREARAVNTIQHPNIIDIFAFGHSPELGHYFVMPRLRGQSLAERIEARRFSVDEALPILAQITAALDAAHAVNITHRDLKPDNIFLVADRRDEITVQLLDFGVAKLLDQDPASVTQTGVQIGTPLFMAPEQWAAGSIDHRTDVYALGIIVHNMFTGRYPFEASSAVGLMNMHCLQQPIVPSAHGAPAAIDRVVARALAKDPLARPQSAGELLAELSEALRAGAAGVTPAAPPVVAPATPPVVTPAARPILTPAAPSSIEPAITPASAAPLTTLGASHGSFDELDVPPRSSRGVVLAMLGVVGIAIAVVVVVTRSGAGGEPASAPGVEAAVEAGVDPADAATPVVTPDARSPGGDAGVSTVAAPIDAGRPRRSADARVAPPPADARVAPPPADARVAPPRPDARAVQVAPADAAPRRAPVDSSWGTTVNPFGATTP